MNYQITEQFVKPALFNINIEEIKRIINEKKSKNENEITFYEYINDMYDHYFLTSERLIFIFDNCPNDICIYLNIPNFIKMLMKHSEFEILEIVTNRFKFFENEDIIFFLIHHKNQIALSTYDLNQLISKYTISNKNKYGYNLILDENINRRYLTSYPSIRYEYKYSVFVYCHGTAIYYLINACEKENLNIVKFLVNLMDDINEIDLSGKTALFYACEKGNEAIVKYLIKHGAKIDIEDYEGETVLHKACESGNVNIVNYLIEHGADINHTVIDGSTPLYYACKSGNKYMVQRLIELGADINKEKGMGYIPLNGADINNKEGMGYIPLYEACKSKKGNKDIVKLFIDNNIDINRENKIGITSIFYACLSGNEDIFNYLMEQKVAIDINKEDVNEQTLLFYACKGGNEAIVKKIVELGSNINKEDINGQTPLFEACKGKNVNVLKYLVECGADIHKENIFGETALFYACERGNEAKAVVKYLIEHGADINKVDKNNQTPLYRACFPRCYEIVHSSLKIIEHLYIENIYWRNENIVNYLIEHGANINKICSYCRAYNYCANL